MAHTSDPSHPHLRWALLAALPVLFVFLGANTIWDANEAFYVETPRQMVLSGDYVNPSFNDAGRFNKPVLSYWVVAALYRTFGISVAVERFGIALGALGIILAAFLIGRALRSTATGVLAALCVVTAPRFVFWSRRIFIDIHVTMYMGLTLACLVLAERFPARRRWYLVLMYVVMGLGVLTKGPVAVVLPGAVVFVWLAFERRLRDLGGFMLLPGALVVAAIVVPWYAELYVQHGWEHITSFFVGENVGRFTTAMVPEGRGMGFYVPVLLTDLFPWAPLVVVPLLTIGAVAWRAPSPHGYEVGAIRRLLWWWIVVVVGAFSLSETKQDLYIFPVVPAVAALAADALMDGGLGGRSRAVGLVLKLVGGAVVILAAGIVWLAGPLAGPWATSGATLAAIALGVAGVGVLIFEGGGRRMAAVLALAGGFTVFNYVLVGVVLPDLERFKPVPSVAAVFGERASPGARLAHFNQSLPSLVFYADRSVDEVPSLESAVEALSGDAEIWLLTSEDHARVIQERVGNSCVALEHPVFDLKVRQVIDRAPPSTVVLLTNRCGRE